MRTPVSARLVRWTAGSRSTWTASSANTGDMNASADTREGPIEDLFSNFMDKSPESLFRRIDPDYHYPTFGDDGIVEEIGADAGQVLCASVEHDENYGDVGQFQDRLHGATSWRTSTAGSTAAICTIGSEATTSFGERALRVRRVRRGARYDGEPRGIPRHGRLAVFPAAPGHLAGSERVRIELRDKASGIVTGVVNLRPGLDYDVDYLQGRMLLAEPLNSTADDQLLVRSGALSGDEAYLVVRYEYTPGFEELDAVAVGGQGHYWIDDHFKLGLTTNSNDEGDTDSSLNGADLTFRKSARVLAQAAGRAAARDWSRRRADRMMAASVSTVTTTGLHRCGGRRVPR